MHPVSFLLVLSALCALGAQGAVWKTPEGREELQRYCHTSARLRRADVCSCIDTCYDTEYAVMAGETRDFLQCVSECACRHPQPLCEHLPEQIRTQGCGMLKAACSRPARDLVRARDPRSLHVTGASRQEDSRFAPHMLSLLAEEGLCAYCDHVSSSIPACMFCTLQK